MANELTLNGSMAYDDGTSSDGIDKVDLSVTLATQKFTHLIQSIGTSEEAMQVGEVTSLGWCFIRNLDATNYVEIRAATGGTKIMKLLAGEFAFFRFGSGVTAPYLIADTAAVRVEFLLASL